MELMNSSKVKQLIVGGGKQQERRYSGQIAYAQIVYSRQVPQI